MRRSTTPSTLSLFETPVLACRFLLVIDPASLALARVMEWRHALRERVGSFSGLQTMPHITLFFADLPVEYERDLLESIAHGCAGQRSFKLHLNGVTHFPDKRTIYIDPVEKDAIAVVRKNIVDHVLMSKPIRKLKVNVTEQPHLTIAAGLEPKQFEEAWAMLEPHVFTSEQRVNDVVLMRRGLESGSLYEHVRTFPLDPA